MADSFDFGRWSRILLALAGFSFVVCGLCFFLLPAYAADNFPWKVSPFVAMTIGGWTLGMGAMALDSARDASFARSVAPTLAVWSFSVLELLVVLAFLGLLRLGSWLTWPYLIALGLGVASAVVGAPAVWRRRDAIRNAHLDGPMPRWFRLIYVLFIVLVWVLSLANVIRGAATGATVFPESLSAFTTLAFGAFFFALGVGTIPLLFTRDIAPAIAYASTGLLLIVFITLAALVNLDKFDFVAHPGTIIYLGTYVVAGIVAAAIVLWHWRTRRGR